MFKVPDGKDPYSEIGKYIRNHITAIEDIIATIEINGIQTNELFLVDENCDFVWESDWYEGEKDVCLIDFFPVSEAQKSVIVSSIEILESLPPAQADLITKIQNGINATNADDAYWCGMRNGMRWCLSLIDDKKPLYEKCPSAQSEIIRCKDCMHNGSYDTDCPIRWNGKEYCSFAEKPEANWIPCKEQMPPAGHWAIWCSKKGLIQVARWKEDAIDHFWPSQEFFQLEDAVAWMPLPKPYSEEE